MSQRLRLRSTGLTWRQVDGRVVVLDLRSSELHELNRAGSALWALLAAEPVTAGEMVQHLHALYRVDIERARGDVNDFVKSLADLGFLDPL